MSVIRLRDVQDTTLWKRLHESFSGEAAKDAQSLSHNLISICEQASARMKRFSALHNEYTLHDDVHLLRVTELMHKIMPKDVADLLNPIEIALLILAAHFHDQGMILEKEEFSALKDTSDFKLFRDNWEIDHPNIKEVRQQLNNRNLAEGERQRYRRIEQEFLDAMVTDYVRRRHGKRSEEYVQNTFRADTQWTVAGSNLAEMVARLCRSHTQSALDLTPQKGFRTDEVFGHYQVNMVYLGLVLRIADILDFDRDRTPDSLYRTIGFRSNVSLMEWEKHRSVEGWIIEPSIIQFTMRCTHPEYQRTAYHFMNYIDQELTDALDICGKFPSKVQHYKLSLPKTVDRTRIEAKDNDYIYHDLEFSLVRDDLVKLLMTDQLYTDPSLCVRELLQNALDALRYRKALNKSENQTEWLTGQVDLAHEVDEHGYEVVSCTDNGVGMDEEIIERFLTRVGRSYYRSPEFEQERIRFQVEGVDFDPCAQFGIGFMSCFMLGDHITIQTRRDYGPSRGYGRPLLVEINGLGGMLVIREGSTNQPVGTTVRILGRKKPRVFEGWQDKVKLISVIQGYALACEFPIYARCTIPEIADSVEIPPEIASHPTPIEEHKLVKVKTLKQDFSEIHPLLRGSVKLSLLVDDNNHCALENSEASWQPEKPQNGRYPFLVKAAGEKIDDFPYLDENQTCLDGILVGGQPGRNDRELYLSSYRNPIQLPRTSFVLDIRGAIKPPLTPSRIPQTGRFGPLSEGPRWDYIQLLANKAYGRLWERLADELGNGLENEVFWQLIMIYGAAHPMIYGMRAGKIWSKISVPVVWEDGRHEWIPIHSLGILLPEPTENPQKKLKYENGGYIGPYDALQKWTHDNGHTAIDWAIATTVIVMSTVVLSEDGVCLELRNPVDHAISPVEYRFRSYKDDVFALPYSSEGESYISIHMPVKTINLKHPLVQVARDAMYLESLSSLQNFAKSAIWLLSSIQAVLPPDEDKKWFARVASDFMDVSWETIAPELKPPYKIRNLTGKIIEITAQDFENWLNG